MFLWCSKMSHQKSYEELLYLKKDILKYDGLLDQEEKTALVFLMCDDAVKAHCILVKNIIENSEPRKILPDLFSFLTSCENLFLKEKLIESLIVIKNIKMVRLLGYESEIKDFINSINRNKCHINLVRKELLRMCEELSVEELTYLIQLVENDFKAKEIHCFHRSSNLMEINILYWIQEGYISDDIEGKKCDVRWLRNHLLAMEKYDLAKKLNDLHDLNLREDAQNLKMIYKDNDIMEKSSDVGCHSKLMTPKNFFVDEDGDVYAMDKNNMGLCVIINQKNFAKSSQTDEQIRHGTDNDRDILKITFSGFGYDIIMLENLDRVSLLRSVEKILKDDVKFTHSSFILCILSHGKRDHVYCVDGSELPVEDIENMIMGDKCPQLLGKPKVVIVQACQGTQLQTAVPLMREDCHEDFSMLQCDGPSGTVVRKIPPTADILTYWATVPGYASLRHRYLGSDFIQTLCSELLKKGNSDHFLDIITSVNREMSQKLGQDSIVVMPQVRGCTNTKKLYFPYSNEHRCKAAESLLMKYVVDHLIRECIIKTALFNNFMKTRK